MLKAHIFSAAGDGFFTRFFGDHGVV